MVLLVGVQDISYHDSYISERHGTQTTAEPDGRICNDMIQ